MTRIPGYRDTPIRPWHRDDPVDVAEAEEFLRLYHGEHPEGHCGVEQVGEDAGAGDMGEQVHGLTSWSK